MRQILFRGKDLSGVLDHSWIFGSLDTTEKEYPSIIYLDRFGNRCRISVNHKTVGQYTGLTDKNGKKIFEGDILKNIESGEIVDICYSGCSFRYSYNNSIYGYGVDDIEKGIVTDEFEVIGNIHDNPELFEVENA
nr:MAG TPA: YopX protein [Bacteriophage sp.]